MSRLTRAIHRHHTEPGQVCSPRTPFHTIYDGEGKRVRKVEYNGGQIQREVVFVYSAGKLVEEYSTDAPPATGTTKWTATDHLGSPRVITDSNGAVVSRRDFKPFGEELVDNFGGRLGENAAQSSNFTYGANDGVRQKFTGYQKDTETGLDFAEARMYENRHGRFTAVDPLLASGKSANPQTFNRYVYVGNNPLARIDPTGTDWFVVTDDKVTYRKTSKVSSPYWNDGDPMNLEGRTRYTGPLVYQVTWGKDKGSWVALDPYEGRSGVFKSQSQAQAQYSQYIKDRNVNLSRGVLDYLAGFAVTPSPEANELIQLLYDWGADAIIGEPDTNSNVYTITNRTTGAVITVGSLTGGPALAEIRAARSVRATVSVTAEAEVIAESTELTPSMCFIGGTLVRTEQGIKRIEKIAAGDLVLSFNETTKKTELQKVTRTFASRTNYLIKLTFEGQREPLMVTKGHPFFYSTWPDSIDRGRWKNSDELVAGGFVLNAHSDWVRILSVEFLNEQATVYNFEVERNHSYFVGLSGLLVHNQCHTPDQQALKEIVKEATNGGRTALSVDDANTILDWAQEVQYPGWRADPGDVLPPPVGHGPVPYHIHIPGAGAHQIPVAPGVLPRPR